MGTGHPSQSARGTLPGYAIGWFLTLRGLPARAKSPESLESSTSQASPDSVFHRPAAPLGLLAVPPHNSGYSAPPQPERRPQSSSLHYPPPKRAQEPNEILPMRGWPKSDSALCRQDSGKFHWLTPPRRHPA